MQNRVEGSLRTKMEELRLVCNREIPIQQQRMESVVAYFRKSLESPKAKAQETVQYQAKLGKVKAQLREVEDDLVKALAVKTRKEAKRIAILDSIASTRARIEELKRASQDQRARKDEYASIISQQNEALAACEEKCDKDCEFRREIEEAISWYNRVLGFRIECGHGVKFIFTNIDLKNPKVEFSFTIRHENDAYTMLDCDPHLNGTKEMIYELNRNNGLFKFVRTMREKFQEAASCGNKPQVTSLDQDSATISLSAPVYSASTDDGSESVAKEKDFQSGHMKKHPREIKHSKVSKRAILSPASAAPLRQSPRLKMKK